MRNAITMDYKCSKCNPTFSFNRPYHPIDFLEGKRSSVVWIIGLNPKGTSEKKESRKTIKKLENYFDNNKIHSYFKDFKKVSEKLFYLFGKEKGVAHTDIVKCYSNEFQAKNRYYANAIEKCKEYLIEQIKIYSPQIIICNGAPVCDLLKNIINIKIDKTTSCIGDFHDKEITVIFSGFIGRIDDYAKRRLGIEIESYMEKYSIGSSVN